MVNPFAFAQRAIACALLLCVLGSNQAQAGPGAVSATDIAPAWAANSVNVVAFRKNALVTAGGVQYAAFYDGQRRLVLARRHSGARQWLVKTTAYSGHAEDAHNAISIMVDGAGVLHVAWDHHNGRLRYARSSAPGSLELGPELPMVGRGEDKVTYPEFHRLPGGDLLFLYRDGGSGNGNLVMNRFDVASGQWRRLHDRLIDGEGKRNAYWQAVVDRQGGIHLSWVWRESADVASNHDLAYARSDDGGVTWQRSDGKPYTLPITADSAEYAARIGQGQALINQTSMAVDASGTPYIASYWRSADSNVPQYRVVFKERGAWKTLSLDFRSTPFSLGGQGTKRIPIARPQLLLNNGAPAGGWLVFRDAERGSKVSVAAIADFGAARWTLHDLTAYSVGDWEPSYDTELWRTDGVLDLFVEPVRQGDGETLTDAAPQMASVLEWKPASGDMAYADIVALIRKVNTYWQNAHAPADRAFWDIAAYHTGNMEAYRLTHDAAALAYSERWAEHNGWQGASEPDPSKWKSSYGESAEFVLFGDWQTCFQTYIDLYRVKPDPRRIARVREVMDYQIGTPKRDYLWWADGLYMVMPVMSKLYQLTGQRRYLDRLHDYFNHAEQLMFDAGEGLFYRDARYVYPAHKTNSGAKDFWARGNGWAFASLAKVLADLPADDPQRIHYLNVYRAMAAALNKSQQPQGYWTRSMQDPAQSPGPETSGTAFFTYGLLWGINHGELDRATYLPVARKAWRYLTEVAIAPDGRVGYVQPIGDRAVPGQVVDQNSSAPFGVGAVLLALAEMARLQASD